MRVLLDTHIFLWWNARPELIGYRLRLAIADRANEIHVSAVSVWEIGIKRALGKLEFTQKIVETVHAHQFQLLPISGKHAEYAAALPRHHTDPFDRLLIAQSLIEGMLLGTQDAKIRPYGVAIIGFRET